MKRLLDRLLRFAMERVQSVRRRLWRRQKAKVTGAHAIALTPEGRIILVRLRYMRGWYLPGGGRKPGESAQENALRELREEVGAYEFGDCKLVLETQEMWEYRSDNASIFLVRDVRYRPPRWSLEVEKVEAFAPDALPPNLSGRARTWIDAGYLGRGPHSRRTRT